MWSVESGEWGVECGVWSGVVFHRVELLLNDVTCIMYPSPEETVPSRMQFFVVPTIISKSSSSCICPSTIVRT